ncbi:MAG: endonuclease/exonuclease/phosphatase family protein [Bacteroidales bacterium]|nr:endonuclease/exonuclease/phosphatase family protein [Bacteroidales bacterium]
MKKSLIPVITVFISGIVGFAQTAPVYYNSFDDVKGPRMTEEAFGSHNNKFLFGPAYSQGIKGMALDLSDEVVARIPSVVDSALTPDYSKDFAFSVWIKTKPGARQGTPIIGNKRNFDFMPLAHTEFRHVCDDTDGIKQNEWVTPGWIAGTTDAGGWYFYISDGQKQYIYYPTVERQKINDGKWHLISGSVDMVNKELWLFKDGCNVAIYNIEEIEAPLTDLATVVGGSDEYKEAHQWEAQREWVAFNGYVDEAKVWDRTISAEEVKAEYSALMPGDPEISPATPPAGLKIQTWNILHGGKRFGEHVGLKRVCEVLEAEKADIIGIVETYGSGAVMADSLGYYYYLISDNLSILSRFPIVSTFKFYKAFKSGGAVLDLGGGQKLTFFDILLDWRGHGYQKIDVEELKKSFPDLVASAEGPVLAVGDFNTTSHLDCDMSLPKNQERFYEDTQSRFMEILGFTDSYRYLRPDYKLNPGYTWGVTLYNRNEQRHLNRVDYIYYKGDELVPFDTQIISHHPVYWPSDHASLVTWFKFYPSVKPAAEEQPAPAKAKKSSKKK